jgi:hypothetical protein
LHSRKTGAEADPLRTSWIAASAVQQGKISATNIKILRKGILNFMMASFPYYGIMMEGASFYQHFISLFINK